MRLLRRSACRILVAVSLALCACESPGKTVPAAPAPAPKAVPTPPAVVKPTLRFEKTTHDFGEVAAGKVVKCDFPFTNPTAVAVKGIRLHESCGCTSSGISDKDIGPGESGKVNVAFRTVGYNGFIERRVTVTAANMAEPIKLYIRCVVVPAKE